MTKYWYVPLQYHPYCMERYDSSTTIRSRLYDQQQQKKTKTGSSYCYCCRHFYYCRNCSCLMTSQIPVAIDCSVLQLPLEELGVSSDWEQIHLACGYWGVPMKSWRQPYGVQDEAGDALLAVYISSSMPQDGYLPAGRIFQASALRHSNIVKSSQIDTSIDQQQQQAPDRSFILIRIVYSLQETIREPERYYVPYSRTNLLPHSDISILTAGTVASYSRPTPATLLQSTVPVDCSWTYRNTDRRAPVRVILEEP